MIVWECLLGFALAQPNLRLDKPISDPIFGIDWINPSSLNDNECTK